MWNRVEFFFLYYVVTFSDHLRIVTVLEKVIYHYHTQEVYIKKLIVHNWAKWVQIS